MAKNRATSERKICATCEYWSGEQICCSPSRRQVEYETNQYAECLAIYGHKSQAANVKCPKYQKLGWMQ